MVPLTERSARALAAAIRAREVTARDVVEAHIELHRRMASRINALVADRFDEARAEADAADEQVRRATSGDELPLLLGVPFTVKETIALEGMPFTGGVVARRGVRAERSAPAVQRLRDAGAIPLGVTNTSELTLWIESVNRIQGRTRNPYDPRRTAGGSSGGEGASVGCGGSPFGVASDIAGSIRVPAAFCGVFGHKPSPGLVPNTGLYPPSSGESGRLLACGPLARRAEDLLPLLQTMAGPDGEDPHALPAVLGDPGDVNLAGLRVAVVEGHSRRPMALAVLQARDDAAAALAGRRASVRRVRLDSWRASLLPYLAALQSGSEQGTGELLQEAGEPPSGWAALLRRGGPHVAATRLALAAERLPPPGRAALQRRLDAARELREELLDAIGDGVLLHPAHPRVAPRHGRTLGRVWLLMPAAIFNLAGVPVTEVPVGLTAAGIPVGVQVAAGPGRDHLTIAVAQALERCFGGWQPPPPPL